MLHGCERRLVVQRRDGGVQPLLGLAFEQFQFDLARVRIGWAERRRWRAGMLRNGFKIKRSKRVLLMSDQVVQ